VNTFSSADVIYIAYNLELAGCLLSCSLLILGCSVLALCLSAVPLFGGWITFPAAEAKE